MAALRSSSRLFLRPRFTSQTPLPLSYGYGGMGTRFYSGEDALPPPLLQKLKGDLKTAMRAKDAPRLTAIRSILASTQNLSKTSNPITTDAQLVALLRRTSRASSDAASEFQAAGRQDLVDKEQQQISIFDSYIAESGVEELSPDQLRTIVAGVVTALTSEPTLGAGKPKMGDVMKKLLAPGGPLEGKDVKKAQLAQIVKEVTGTS
ncbi:GatB/YqeY domain-containing protein [Hypoxylon trugodes]|uniref:GatB/YqeY domain-containing protein n=1 Tax=Hypoxylon trugodes TaxID=326681 RepID=UPI002191ABD7|nr:GatB/YqeY domain-containing protein [Hypoxylon trugodes]KAI1386259.1 GatB/YqeY domain-containing protein [Hypoxylon trugodes]